MKISDIKTTNEFYDFADIWYQRTLNLRDIWHDKNESEKRRLKAFYLWNIMAKRVLYLSDIALKLNQRVFKHITK